MNFDPFTYHNQVRLGNLNLSLWKNDENTWNFVVVTQRSMFTRKCEVSSLLYSRPARNESIFRNAKKMKIPIYP